MRLQSIRLLVPIAMPGLPMRVTDELTLGKGTLAGWQVHVRGPRVILVSPKGWTPGSKQHERSGEACVLFDLPREHVMLRWEGTDADVDAVSKWSPGPLAPIVQTSAKPTGLESQVAKDKGMTNESGVALASDAAVDAPDESPALIETPADGPRASFDGMRPKKGRSA